VKAVRLTAHAQTVAAERDIPRTLIEKVARSPDWAVADPFTAAAERRFGIADAEDGRILRVVCIETDAEIRVITVSFDRNAKRPA
jgi:hypothetical protein